MVASEMTEHRLYCSVKLKAYLSYVFPGLMAFSYLLINRHIISQGITTLSKANISPIHEGPVDTTYKIPAGIGQANEKCTTQYRDPIQTSDINNEKTNEKSITPIIPEFVRGSRKGVSIMSITQPSCTSGETPGIALPSAPTPSSWPIRFSEREFPHSESLDFKGHGRAL